MTDQEPEPFRLPAEIEECYRYEISGAMDSVVLYCHDVVDRHSHRRLWTPKGNHPDHRKLITQARAVIAKLRMVIDCAETIAREIETDQQRHEARAQRHREARE
ncbi:hypothetical protein [Streptomyces sp. NPDC049881]|uniref:hypothetical protein n=1 Tax=Streptomyces sp. NPDC049881 TaxID=3155778 RepID=UPI00341DB505